MACPYTQPSSPPIRSLESCNRGSQSNLPRIKRHVASLANKLKLKGPRNASKQIMHCGNAADTVLHTCFLHTPCPAAGQPRMNAMITGRSLHYIQATVPSVCQVANKSGSALLCSALMIAYFPFLFLCLAV